MSGDPPSHEGLSAQTLLHVRELYAGYGSLPVLRGVNLTVGAGELVAVLGPNGAGKSTLLRAISRFDATITAGSVTFDGRDLAGVAPQALIRAGLAHVPEGRQLFTEMSVDDNVRLGAYTRRDATLEARTAEMYARFPALAARKTASAFSLSGGEQQMLALARALIAQPKLLLLRTVDRPRPTGRRDDLQHHRRTARRRHGDLARRTKRLSHFEARRSRLRPRERRHRPRRQRRRSRPRPASPSNLPGRHQ